MSEHGETTPTNPVIPKAKRPAVTERTWINADGTETKDPREAKGVRIEVIGSGPVEVFAEQMKPGVRNAAELFGYNIVLTNTMGGLRGDEAMEAMLARLETLEAGEWTSRKGAEGPRVSLLVEAVVAAYAKAGKTKDPEEVKLSLLEKGDEGRKAVLANPQVKAEYDRLRAEAAAERAAESAAKAGSSEGDLDSLDL